MIASTSPYFFLIHVLLLSYISRIPATGLFAPLLTSLSVRAVRNSLPGPVKADSVATAAMFMWIRSCVPQSSKSYGLGAKPRRCNSGVALVQSREDNSSDGRVVGAPASEAAD